MVLIRLLLMSVLSVMIIKWEENAVAATQSVNHTRNTRVVSAELLLVKHVIVAIDAVVVL
jgi:hypothetical protein